MKLWGVDISLYQKDFDFAKALKEGVKYAIIKAGEDEFVDPYFERHYSEAKKVGMPVGAYWFLHAATEADAKKEARFAANKALNGKQFEYPIFVDVEYGPLAKLGKAKLTSVVRAFCETMEDLGYWCGFYTNLDWYTYKLDGPSLAERFSFWFAYWGGTQYDLPNVQMWQQGAKTIAGVNTDYDWCYVDYPGKIKAKGKNGYSKPTPTPTPAPKPAPKPTPTPKPSNELKAGDKVMIEKAATVYGRDVKFAPWVYTTVYTVFEISGNRVVFGTGSTTVGATDKKYVKKV